MRFQKKRRQSSKRSLLPDIRSSIASLMIFTISARSFLRGSLRLRLPVGVSESIRSINQTFRKRKTQRRNCLSSFERRGRLDERKTIAADDLITIYGADDASEAESVAEVLRRHLATVKPGDYIAFLNYIEETPEIDRKFQELRTALRDATQCAVTIGYGPRFLHSTGQLHKGGPDTGVFFQIIANDARGFRDSR